ncbi:K P-type ATPase (mediates high-affinity potassium or sodium uptake) [Fusarium acutatum]|uniref:K P-type ATPase (Mediates high-affinity potassium or sodium uptake) n=1 Tax=Fusarium acutatum TaxID=78861 RepID=A0A8H4JSL2_9HYPO|nr:K P-type ATPase (mediates high-affinity potassium or sodium uptake) [Fusarium acutatum]
MQLNYPASKGQNPLNQEALLSGACSAGWESLVSQEEPQVRPPRLDQKLTRDIDITTVLQTGNALPENEEQAYAQMPFDSSLPIWPRTPMLKEFTLTSAVRGPDWHIDSFQQYGPKVSPRDWQDMPWIGSHGSIDRENR